MGEGSTEDTRNCLKFATHAHARASRWHARTHAHAPTHPPTHARTHARMHTHARAHTHMRTRTHTLNKLPSSVPPSPFPSPSLLTNSLLAPCTPADRFEHNLPPTQILSASQAPPTASLTGAPYSAGPRYPSTVQLNGSSSTCINAPCTYQVGMHFPLALLPHSAPATSPASAPAPAR